MSKLSVSSKSHLTYQDWHLTETQLCPEQLNARETTFTLGNGYLSSRGSFEEGYPGSNAMTLINGVYDAIPIFYTELANCPNWLPLEIAFNGEKFRLDRGDIIHYQRQLDLRAGVLRRHIRWRSPQGRTLDLHFERFASQSDQHVLALRCQITPLDFSGHFQVRAGIDGTAENAGFNHWHEIDQAYTPQYARCRTDISDSESSHQRDSAGASIWLHTQTRKSKIDLAMAAAVTVHPDSNADTADFQATVSDVSMRKVPRVAIAFEAKAGQTVTVEKRVTVFTSRDVAAPLAAAQTKLRSLGPFNTLLQETQATWAQLWENSDIEIEGDTKSQLMTRYNLFQLLIAAPQHDDRVSIPAKTLSGPGYRGHIFWDTEFFVLPFFIYTQPEIARNLLTYRYHTLPGARRKAAHYGYQGAMYAWESAATGEDVTPRWDISSDPHGEDVRIWCRDRELHISSVVPRAIWLYWHSTQDHAWMRDYGAEIMLDTALFWSSRVEYDIQCEQWVIRDVIGPDEYHEQVDNNAFTNYLVKWHLQTALEVYEWLETTFPERAEDLTRKLNITKTRRQRWRDIANHLRFPIDPDTGLIEQFDGFFQLKDIDLSKFEPRTASIQALIGIHGTNTHQVLKQPDVLMLLYIMGAFPETDFGADVLKANWDYYAPRTDVTYGSSLGPAIQGLLAAQVGERETASQCFELAGLVDLEDTRGNANEGIHSASCGNIWQAVVFGAAGIQFTEQGPVAHPQLPPSWKRLKFKLFWRDAWYSFDLQPDASAPVETPAAEQASQPPLPTVPESTTVATTAATIRGVIFDLDGVITDTAEYHYRSWQRLADEENIPFDRAKNDTMRGLSRRESLLQIMGVDAAHAYSEAQLEEMMDRKNRYYQASIKDISPRDILPGAKALVEELRAAGIKVAIGSSSKNAHAVLEQLGMRHLFDVIADGHSVNRSKPAPDIFLHAAERLGLSPQTCVVIEDASAGVEAAIAGGMMAVGIGPQERFDSAALVLPDLADVDWSYLQSQLVHMEDMALVS